MRNERLHEGNRLSLPVPAGTASSAPVLVFGIPGVTATKEGEGGNIAGRATVWTEGVFDVSTPDAVGAEGTPIYITAANALTVTAAGNTLFGRTVADADGAGGTKAAGAGTVHVRLAKV
ncbi:MAG TPA: DUF2190 family protein [Intrasporangium sp.]|uniref:DUF2190 family protein n=1 Tax=Intrasporangium sp. TaxID=1925024 RepID=UPI002D793C53|nr:DUF2190 family protein [Intrasporangium sp.]HET7398987.1 DUF2190 family protein [Intrasporangium sp.]